MLPQAMVSWKFFRLLSYINQCYHCDDNNFLHEEYAVIRRKIFWEAMFTWRNGQNSILFSVYENNVSNAKKTVVRRPIAVEKSWKYRDLDKLALHPAKRSQFLKQTSEAFERLTSFYRIELREFTTAGVCLVHANARGMKILTDNRQALH